tara:strand:+ start:204 stop:536 length:333 start_codon:yes stop_codon:yes gene_type:complete
MKNSEMILGLLAAYGLSAIFIESTLFSWLRFILRAVRLGKLASCYRCLGFWTGLGVALYVYGFDDLKGPILFPFAASGVSYLLSKLNPSLLQHSNSTPSPVVVKNPPIEI